MLLVIPLAQSIGVAVDSGTPGASSLPSDQTPINLYAVINLGIIGRDVTVPKIVGLDRSSDPDATPKTIAGAEPENSVESLS
jgi:hypothetical protein